MMATNIGKRDKIKEYAASFASPAQLSSFDFQAASFKATKICQNQEVFSVVLAELLCGVVPTF
jgi:hypothetical protein